MGLPAFIGSEILTRPFAVGVTGTTMPGRPRLYNTPLGKDCGASSRGDVVNFPAPVLSAGFGGDLLHKSNCLRPSQVDEPRVPKMKSQDKNRRAILRGLAVMPAVCVPILAQADEQPWSKARRLADELGETLNHCDNGSWRAEIAPSRRERHNVLFVVDLPSELDRLLADYQTASQAYARAAKAHQDAWGSLPVVEIQYAERRRYDPETKCCVAVVPLVARWRREILAYYQFLDDGNPLIGERFRERLRSDRDDALARYDQLWEARRRAEEAVELERLEIEAFEAEGVWIAARKALFEYSPQTINDAKRKNVFLLSLLREKVEFDEDDLASIFGGEV